MVNGRRILTQLCLPGSIKSHNVITTTDTAVDPAGLVYKQYFENAQISRGEGRGGEGRGGGWLGGGGG